MARLLQIGVQLPEVEWEARWSDVADMARAAEDIGIDSLWVGDHLLYRYADGASRGPWEAWSTLAGLAAITKRVRLGPLVAATSFHAPAMLAKKAVTVDEISGGRLVLGLGAGWNETEYRAFGFPYDHRVSRFEEAFTIIRTLLAEGAVDFEGRYYTARECELVPRGPRPGSLPLMVGSLGPRMLSISLPHVQMWNAWHDWFGNRPEGLAPVLAKLDAACDAAGRDRADVVRTATLHLRMPGGGGRAAGDDGKPRAPQFEGEPEAVAAALRAYADLGIGEVQLVLDPITTASVAALAPVLAHLERG